MEDAFEDKIRQRAYEIWMAAGMVDGDAEKHWLHAEHVVSREAAAPVVSKVVRATPKVAAKGKAPVAVKSRAVKSGQAKSSRAAAPSVEVRI